MTHLFLLAALVFHVWWGPLPTRHHGGCCCTNACECEHCTMEAGYCFCCSVSTASEANKADSPAFIPAGWSEPQWVAGQWQSRGSGWTQVWHPESQSWVGERPLAPTVAFLPLPAMPSGYFGNRGVAECRS